MRRGYETFMEEFFRALRSEPGFEFFLFKGGGDAAPGEIPLRNLRRESLLARLVAEVVRRGPYVVEQATFAASLLPHLERERPDLIFFCDPAVGKVLDRWRRWRHLDVRLVFHNGGPTPPPFPWYDHVHQVTPCAVDDALAAGYPRERQTLIPSGLALDVAPPPSRPEQEEVRRRLRLPADRAIVLSVGALNRRHKRMDYLIHEVARLPRPRPYLVMLGHEEADTRALGATAMLRLGNGNFTMRSVPHGDVAQFYRAADLFVLASLTEGFGLVWVEALAHGLPCVAHDFPVARFVLGNEGSFADLRVPGALAQRIQELLSARGPADAALRRQRVAQQRFAWRNLGQDYLAMLRTAAGYGADTA